MCQSCSFWLTVICGAKNRPKFRKNNCSSWRINSKTTKWCTFTTCGSTYNENFKTIGKLNWHILRVKHSTRATPTKKATRDINTLIKQTQSTIWILSSKSSKTWSKTQIHLPGSYKKPKNNRLSLNCTLCNRRWDSEFWPVLKPTKLRIVNWCLNRWGTIFLKSSSLIETFIAGSKLLPKIEKMGVRLTNLSNRCALDKK